MRSTKIQAARNLYGQLYNALRADAEGATWLLPHQQTGYYALATNATNGQTATFTVNGSAVVVTLVTSLGSTPNNVLIGASAAATALNIFNFLRSPNVTTSTQVAAIAANCQLLSFVEWKQVGTTITACSLNNDTYAPLTSFSGSTTVTSGTYTAQAMQLFVEKGQFLLGGSRVAFAGGSSPTIAAPVSHPRIDLLTINASGTLALVTGTENVSPSAPAYPKNVVTLCEIYSVVGETSITDSANQVSGQGYVQYDVRPLVQNADLKVSQSAAEVSGTDTGGINVYTIAPSPAIAAYATGMLFSFIAAHTNTGSSTLAVSGLSAVTIHKSGTRVLSPADIVAGQSYTVMYDGANFQLMNPTVVASPQPFWTVAQIAVSGTTYTGVGIVMAAPGTYGAFAMYQGNNSDLKFTLNQIAALVLDSVMNGIGNGVVAGYNGSGLNTRPASSNDFGGVVNFTSTLTYLVGCNGTTYTGEYYISGTLFNSVTFNGSPPSPASGTIMSQAFTDGTYVYLPLNNTGTFAQFSVSGSSLMYVASTSYTAWATYSNGYAYCDGTYVYTGLAKWTALTGGAVAATYGGSSTPQGFVFGLSAATLGYAYLTQLTTGATTVWTYLFVQSVPKF